MCLYCGTGMMENIENIGKTKTRHCVKYRYNRYVAVTG